MPVKMNRNKDLFVNNVDGAAWVAQRIRIIGLVQGVGYRAWATEAANRLGIDGWVRNRIDGTVELVAVGPADAVAALIEVCRTGPRAARVDDLRVEETPGIVARGFNQKPTV